MKKRIAVIILIVFSIALFFVYQNYASSAEKTVLVTQVVDGDTITVEGGIRVRLLGIDAPERGEPFYSEARDFLKAVLLHKEVVIEQDRIAKDRYGRQLRHVWLGRALVNAEIVRKGLAIAKDFEPNSRYKKIIAEAEQEAIAGNLGIWSAIQHTRP